MNILSNKVSSETHRPASLLTPARGLELLRVPAAMQGSASGIAVTGIRAPDCSDRYNNLKKSLYMIVMKHPN